MWIRYFVPEDGDDPKHPNVYQAELGRNVTLSAIKKSFPLAGNYHFRFLKEIDRLSVWLDIIDDDAPIPVQEGSIFIKASRITSFDNTPIVNNNSSQSSIKKPNEKPVTRPPGPEKANSEKLLNFTDDEPSPASKKVL
jgi:hypothetical protein